MSLRCKIRSIYPFDLSCPRRMKFILLGFFPLVFARPDGYEPYDQPCTPGEHCPRNDNVTCGMYHIINKRKLEFPSYF